MARRKKEPQSVHRKAIAFVAQYLFVRKDLERLKLLLKALGIVKLPYMCTLRVKRS